MSDGTETPFHPRIAWTDAGKAYLASLHEACVAEGFTVREGFPYDHRTVWEATVSLDGPLGKYELRVWTTWGNIHEEDHRCQLELTLRHAAGRQQFDPSYNAHGIEGFREELEYLRLLMRNVRLLQGMLHAIKSGADPTWRKTQRPGFIALLRQRELEATGPRGSA